MLAIVVFTFTALVAVSVNSCIITSYKRYGESCSCKEACLDGAQCLGDNIRGLSCSCLPCQYYDNVLRQCINTPDYGDVCYGVCSSNYVCLNSTNGVTTCQCLSNQIYNDTIQACVNLPERNQPCTTLCASGFTCINSTCRCPDGTQWNSTANICQALPNQVCLQRSQANCQGYATKNYPACSPDCRDGIYMTCLYGQILVRDCPMGNYRSGQAKLVFNPTTDSCEFQTPYCPRPLDSQVL